MSSILLIPANATATVAGKVLMAADIGVPAAQTQVAPVYAAVGVDAVNAASRTDVNNRLANLVIDLTAVRADVAALITEVTAIRTNERAAGQMA